MVSADGQYKWDGHAWVSIAHQLSPDGFWRWDGYNWVPSGQVAPPPLPGRPNLFPHMSSAAALPPPAAKKAGSSGGKVVAIVVGTALAFGAGVMIIASQNGGVTNNNVPVPTLPVAGVSVGQIHPTTCKTTDHAGMYVSITCNGSVDVVINEDISSGNIGVDMTTPYSDVLHGNATVKPGFRGTITVPTQMSVISSCIAAPNFPTTVRVVNGVIGTSYTPLLISSNAVVDWAC